MVQSLVRSYRVNAIITCLNGNTTNMRHLHLILSVSCLLVLDMVHGHNVFLSSICSSVVPKSENYRMSNYSKSPYYLIQSSNHFEDDRPILVELGGSSFRGFLLVAVDPLTGTRIGKWMEARGTYVLPCAAIIHSDYRIKKHALLVWQPPLNMKGHVAFEATILDVDNRFIVGQVSILPHQLYTHYQMNAIYEQISPSLDKTVPNGPNLNWSNSAEHRRLHPLVATRREHTLADILAQGSQIIGRQTVNTNNAEPGTDSQILEKANIETKSPLKPCDQQASLARITVLPSEWD